MRHIMQLRQFQILCGLGQMRHETSHLIQTLTEFRTHQLNRHAAEICLLHALETLEGSLAPMPCLEDHDDGESGSVCAQQWVWREIYDDMRARLQAVTLADLAAREQERLRASATSYSI